jgi:hypothetical protein
VSPSTTSPASSSIPDCLAGDELWQTVSFPQCWNGRDLDASDHVSHMAYPTGAGCPATHPVAIPEITFNIVYPVGEAGAPRHWRLASDTYDANLPAGYSSHTDWFNGWQPDIARSWVARCLRPAVDCHSHLLGDGRRMDF